MSLSGAQSRFACLKVDDDSDESGNNDQKQSNRSVKGLKKGSANTKKGSENTSATGLIAHVITKRKNKGKKKKVLESSEDNYPTQIDEGEDEKFQREMTIAIENSLKTTVCSSESASEAPHSQVVSENNEGDSEIQDGVSEFDLEVSKILHRNGIVNNKFLSDFKVIYNGKLTAVLQQLDAEHSEKMKAVADANKYQTRYKKICELLKDAEVNEKARLLVDLENARKIETELSTQIGDLQGELMQCRSKVRELELANKKLMEKH